MNFLSLAGFTVIALAAISSNMYTSDMEPSAEYLPCQSKADANEVLVQIQRVQYLNKVLNA